MSETIYNPLVCDGVTLPAVRDLDGFKAWARPILAASQMAVDLPKDERIAAVVKTLYAEELEATVLHERLALLCALLDLVERSRIASV